MSTWVGPCLCGDSCPDSIAGAYSFTISGVGPTTPLQCPTCNNANGMFVLSPYGIVPCNYAVGIDVCFVNSIYLSFGSNGSGDPIAKIDMQSNGPQYESGALGAEGCITPITVSLTSSGTSGCMNWPNTLVLTPIAWSGVSPQGLLCIVPLATGNAPGSNLGPGPMAWNNWLAACPTNGPQLADDVAIQGALGGFGGSPSLFSPMLSPPRPSYTPVLSAMPGPALSNSMQSWLPLSVPFLPTAMPCFSPMPSPGSTPDMPDWSDMSPNIFATTVPTTCGQCGCGG